MFIIKVTRLVKIFPEYCDVIGNVIIIVRITWIQAKIHYFAGFFSWPLTWNLVFEVLKGRRAFTTDTQLTITRSREHIIFRAPLTECFQWRTWNPVKHLRWSFFGNNYRLKAINYFCKKLHRRCLTGFEIRLWFPFWFRYKLNPFNTPWKHHRTFGFLVLSGGIIWEHWPEMG